MSSFGVVVLQPFIQISLQRFDAFVELLAERDLVELLQDRFMKPLADTVCLRRFHLGLCVIYIVDCQKKLEFVLVDAPTIFGPPVCQDA